MTTREFFLERHSAEKPAFINVLKALPADKLDYKPHERSPSAQQLVWTLTQELRNCIEAGTRFRTEWIAQPAPSMDEMLRIYEQRYTELGEVVSKMDDAAWSHPAEFVYNGQVVLSQPAGEFIWFILFDAIHHRGQLSTYIRPMGGRVPSIYGPSADSRE
jgi:uncharacterized damage-inducible protein DinB